MVCRENVQEDPINTYRPFCEKFKFWEPHSHGKKATLTRQTVSILEAVLGLVGGQGGITAGVLVVDSGRQFPKLLLHPRVPAGWVRSRQLLELVGEVTGSDLCVATLQCLQQGVVEEHVLRLRGSCDVIGQATPPKCLATPIKVNMAM